MAAPWRGGSRPADGGFPTAPADSDQPQRPNWSTSQPDVMVAGHSYSTSGTFSTTYTSSWGSAVVSSGVEDEVEDAKRLDLTKCLLKEFCRGDGDAVSALESWLSEIGVGWVLQPSDNASAGTTGLLPDDQRNLSQKRSLWIGALTAIMESIRACKYSDPSHWIWDLGIPFHITNFRLGRLVQATVVKMFPFVDALVATAADLDATDGIITDVGNRAHVLLGKLQPLLDVRNALSSASQVIEFSYWEFSEETKVIRRSDKARSLLSAKTRKLDEAIWNTMEEIRIGILTTNDDDDTELGIQTPQGSSDIANYTRSLMAYIKSLWNNSKLLDKIVRTATELGRYIPDPDISSYLLLLEKRKADPLTVLTLKMVFSLQVKLAKRSESFADNGLRFLFLINNTNFIYQQLRPFFSMKFLLAVLISKKEEYIQKYLQVSWAPVLSCLNNQTPRWFGKKTKSALPKFDSEFQKTYDEQKFWKVPDPQLRTRLRQAIIERVVPAFTKYLKDNKITKPGFTPQEREMMLWELFEG